MVDVRPPVSAPGAGWVDATDEPAGRGVLAASVAAAVRLTDADTAGVLLADRRGRSVRMRACAGRWTVNSPSLTVRAGRGLAGRILVTRKPWKVDDYDGDTTVDCGADLRAVIDADGTRSGLGVPMLDGDDLVGVLMVWSRRPGAFDAAATQALAGLAEVVTAALVASRRADAERLARAEVERRLDLLAVRAEDTDQRGRLRADLMAGVLAGAPLDALLVLVRERTDGEAAVLDHRLGVLAASGDVEGLLARVAPLRTDEVAARRLLEPAGTVPARWTLVHRLPGQERSGLLAVSLPHPPTSRDEASVAETATACALAIGRERAVLEARSREQGDLVLQLVDGAVDDAVAAARARRLGAVLPQRFRVLVVPVRGCGPPDDEPSRLRLDALLEAAGRASAAGGATPLAARRGSEVVVLLGAGPPDGETAAGEANEPHGADATDAADCARSRARAVLAAMRRLAPDAVRAAGVSAAVDGTAGLPAALRQARQALATAHATSGDDAAGPGVVLFDDLGLLRFLLAPSDRDDRRRFVRAVLGAVLDYDAAHHGDLVRTLGAYLDAGCSLTRAAADLFVHPKTVRYRLRRVEELSGRDLAAQRDRFDAQVAMTVLRAMALDGPDGATPGP